MNNTISINTKQEIIQLKQNIHKPEEGIDDYTAIKQFMDDTKMNNAFLGYMCARETEKPQKLKAMAELITRFLVNKTTEETLQEHDYSIMTLFAKGGVKEQVHNELCMICTILIKTLPLWGHLITKPI
jgi:hypothetical protein